VPPARPRLRERSDGAQYASGGRRGIPLSDATSLVTDLQRTAKQLLRVSLRVTTRPARMTPPKTPGSPVKQHFGDGLIDPGYLEPMSHLDFLDQGSLGVFYPWLGTEPPDDEHKERGWIVRSDDWVHVDALEERDTPGVTVNGHFEADRFPEALVGRLPSTTVIALELLPRGSTKVFGLNASTRRYRARTLVADVPLDRLRSSRLTSLTSEYLGLGHWSGIRAGEETWTQAPDGTIQEFELKVGAPSPDARVRLSGGRSIAVSAHWSVTGPNDDRRIRMPMAV
jgi:hypothetical protein